MIQVSDLHQQARNRLQALPGNPKKLVLIHTIIALGSSFLLTVITYLLDRLIEGTGGLSGLGLRSVLTTVQNVLMLTVTMALPFWQMGILYAALQWEQGTPTGFGSLLQGFRRFGSALGMHFFRSALMIALSFAAINIGTIIFMMTPFTQPLLELIAPMTELGITPEQVESLMTPEWVESAFHASVPLLIIADVLYVIAAIPLFYRLRFADFAVMDGLTAGKALLKSFVITRKQSLQVFQLDLSFWWFYLLQILTVLLYDANTILPAIGISLPVSGVAGTLIFSALSILCQSILLWQWEGHRLTAYALAYRTLDGTIGSGDMDIQP